MLNTEVDWGVFSLLAVGIMEKAGAASTFTELMVRGGGFCVGKSQGAVVAPWRASHSITKSKGPPGRGSPQAEIEEWVRVAKGKGEGGVGVGGWREQQGQGPDERLHLMQN